jgi:hypothetical protein
VAAAPLLLVGGATSALQAGWLDERWLHVCLAYGVAAVAAFGVLGSTTARRRAVGAVALVCLALLSAPAQMPGLVGLALLAVLVETSVDEPLAALLALVGLRVLFVHIFEGEFSFSHLEIQLGYVANPGTRHLVGAATILAKLLLPMFAGVLFVLARFAPAARRRIVLGVAVFFAFRLLHIALSMMVARGTFYSPYADAGQLLFHVLFFAGALVLLALDRLGDEIARTIGIPVEA